MYEKFRNRIIAELTPKMDEENIRKVLQVMDVVATDYDINEAQRALVVWQGGLPEEAKMYLVSMKMKGLSDGTVKNYRLILSRFFSIVRKPITEIVSNDIRAFFYVYRKQNDITDRTADKYRDYLSSFFAWMLNNEYLSKNPMRNIEQIKYEKKQRCYLDHMELELLRDACKTPREKLIVEFMFSTGCRISEMANLDINDIDLKNGTVHLFGKGKKHRESFLNAKTIIAINEYMATRNDRLPCFILDKYIPRRASTDSIRREFNNIVARTTITKHITPHNVRHTTASLALQAGMPIDEVSKLLGHSNLSTTQIYAERDRSELQSAHRKYLS